MTTDSAQQPTMTTPEPAKEHKWLQKLVGEWTAEGEMNMGPGQPAEKMTGTESVRALGGLWVIAEGGGGVAGGDGHTSILTLGYDPQKKRFAGTFISSMMTYMWQYDGELSGNTLTLTADGPSMSGDGSTSTYRDVIEFKSDDHRIFSSQMQDDKGNWQQFMTTHYRKK